MYASRGVGIRDLLDDADEALDRVFDIDSSTSTMIVFLKGVAGTTHVYHQGRLRAVF